MTPTEHAELSAAVARAIGWPQVLQWGTWLGRHDPHVTVMSPRDDRRIFDYRSPDVALGLLKWLGEQNCYIRSWLDDSNKIYGWSAIKNDVAVAFDRTTELAVARAVLAVALKGKV